LKKFEDKPDYKLSMIDQHYKLATVDLDAQSLLQFSAIDDSYQSQMRLMPFWVKGDPGSSQTFCYIIHFVTYLFSWLFVGAFIVDFVHDAAIGNFPKSTAQLGQYAVSSQALYSVSVMLCGLAEESRTEMSSYSKCQFRKRYAINFALTMLLAIMYMLSGESRQTRRKITTAGEKMVVDDFGFDKGESKEEQKTPETNAPKSGEKDAKSGEKEAKSGEKDAKSGEKGAKSGEKDAKSGEKEAPKSGEKEAPATPAAATAVAAVNQQTLLQRILTRKSIYPFIGGFFACLLFYGLMC